MRMHHTVHSMGISNIALVLMMADNIFADMAGTFAARWLADDYQARTRHNAIRFDSGRRDTSY